MNMQAVTVYLKKLSEQNPAASYYNVDVLKYQVSIISLIKYFYSTYNLCFSFISCPNTVLYGNFSPLIQDPVQSHLLYLATMSYNPLLSRTFPQPFLVCHDIDIFEEPDQLHSFYLAITIQIAQFSVINYRNCLGLTDQERNLLKRYWGAP